jgi:hypothetical protein
MSFSTVEKRIRNMEKPMCAKERKATKETQAEAKNEPVHEIRVANVRATFWENGDWCSVTFSRLYQSQGSTRWESTSSFRRTDMGNLALLAVKAEAWLESWVTNRQDAASSVVELA